MPLYKQIELATDTILQIWMLKEDVATLFTKALLGKQEMVKYSRITHPKRKLEFLGSRILLHNFFLKSQILYDSMGVPYINNSDINISVSHTKGVVCLLHSPKICGVDIEAISSRTLQLADRFISQKEMKLIDDKFPERTTTLIWSVKETLFKMFRTEGIDFTKQFCIQYIDDKTIVVLSYVNGVEKKHVVYYDFIGEYVLTWSFNENKNE